MSKRRNLNGIPHNLIKSFFGTLRYYNGGYMADWLWNAATQLKLDKATIDILNKTIIPAELSIHPLIINLQDLKTIIEKELVNNDFPLDFIIELKINIEFVKDKRTFYCYPIMIDKEEHKYELKRIFESATEPIFDAFDEKNIYPMKFKNN